MSRIFYKYEDDAIKAGEERWPEYEIRSVLVAGKGYYPIRGYLKERPAKGEISRLQA